MTHAPGKAHRDGISLFELTEMFPDEEAAVRWFEGVCWPDGRICPRCRGENTRETPRRKPMPYWCSDCKSYFSVRTGTALECSRLPLRKWAFAIYLVLTNLKSVSSMKLHRDLKVTQKTAWFMIHRIREAWADDNDTFDGPVEIDETYMGGSISNMNARERIALRRSGKDNKTIVLGMKDRPTNNIQAQVVEDASRYSLWNVIAKTIQEDAVKYTDEHSSYRGLSNHRAVNHSKEEYVRGDAHTNGIESFWSMLKRAHKGTFHKISPKHMQRYVNEFAGRHNIRDLDTLNQMQYAVLGLVGRRLMYRDLIA